MPELQERDTHICENVNPDRPGSAYGYVDTGGRVGGQSEYVMVVPYADFQLLKFPMMPDKKRREDGDGARVVSFSVHYAYLISTGSISAWAGCHFGGPYFFTNPSLLIWLSTDCSSLSRFSSSKVARTSNSARWWLSARCRIACTSPGAYAGRRDAAGRRSRYR